MHGFDVHDATVDDTDRDLAVTTLWASDRLVGPDGILQGGFASATVELAGRAAAEAMLGVEPGSPAVPAATMMTVRLHQPTPVATNLTAVVERVDDTTFAVRTVVEPGDDEVDDWAVDLGDEDRIGDDVLVSGDVEFAGPGPQPMLDDLVELATMDKLPDPVALPMAPACVVCGTDHPTGQRLFPGWVDGSHVVQEWTPGDDVADDNGRFVDPAALAAVLDCPTVFACRDHLAANGFAGSLLGGFTVAWFSRLPVGETVRIVARMNEADGRKMQATSAVIGLDGHVHAAANAFQVGVTSFPGSTATAMPAFGEGAW